LTSIGIDFAIKTLGGSPMTKKTPVLFLMFFAILFAATPALSAPYDLTIVFSDTINTPAPYARVTLTSTAGGVDFKLENLTPGQLVGDVYTSKLMKFYFNYKGSASLSWVDPTDWDIAYSLDNQQADGDGKFDFLVDALNNNFLGTNQALNFTVSGDNDLANFVDVSVLGGGQGVYYFAAHIGNLYDPAGNSAWVGSEGTPIPEPATMLLIGSGLIGLAGYGRKKFFTK
jgi:hypothetical protein